MPGFFFKFHAEIYFDHDLQSYVLVDQGSQNGTVVNGKQILQVRICINYLHIIFKNSTEIFIPKGHSYIYHLVSINVQVQMYYVEVNSQKELTIEF